MALGWQVVHGGRTPPPGEVVRPGERLSWPRTIGLGAQHVVAMFGATFVFPLVMGLNPQLAVMLSGVATILFLLIVNGKVPSYLGTSASFVSGVAAIYAQDGTQPQVTGAILVAGVVLALVGVLIHFLGSAVLYRVLPPVVTGAVVMLIGFNLAPVVANIYWPQDQWVALLTMVVVILMAVGLRGFIGRIAIFVGLVFGYAVSWLFDRIFGQITSVTGAGEVTTHYRVDWAAVSDAKWLGLPPKTDLANGVVGWHFPDIKWAFVLLVLPAVIALVAENAGHVKAVAEMTGDDLDPVMGKAIGADGVGTVVASTFGGSPTTTYAENIGVMAATRVYSTAAYYVAAVVAICLRSEPEVRRGDRADAGRRPRRDHGRALRHDRPARGQDLDREPRQLRQPREPRAGGGRDHHRHRQHVARVHRHVLTGRDRVRDDRRGRRTYHLLPAPCAPAHLKEEGALIAGRPPWGPSR